MSAFRSLFCVVLGLAGCRGTSPDSDQAAAVLARHLAWCGGATAWQAIQGLQLTGELEASGLHGGLTVTLHRDGYVRQQYDLGTIAGGEGIDAVGGWRRNASGQLEGLPAADVARLRGDLALAFLDHAVGEPASRATWVRTDQIDGVAVDVIALPADDVGGQRQLWIDGDGALHRSEREFDGRRRQTGFADWRQVGGVRISFAQEVRGGDTQRIRWQSIRPLAELPVAELARPAVAAPAVAGTSGPVVVPLDLHEGRYLFARGRIGEVDTDIVVDSGAGITVVDQELAAAAGLKGQGQVTARGVGGEGRPVQLCRGVTLRLGDLELPPLTVAILDLGEVHRKIGRRMPVILGKELFHARPVTVDYAQSRLVLHEPDNFVPPAGAHELPLRPLDDGHVMVQLQLEDLPPCWCMVDTGSGDTVMFHLPYVRENGLLQRWERLGERTVSGVGGFVLAKQARAHAVTFAGVQFAAVPVSLATDPRGAMASATSDGTLGAGLLSRFVVTFDHAGKRLLLVPAADAVTRSFRADRLGLTPVEQDGAVVLEHVGAGSPAAEAGLRAGDRITAIDGVAVDVRSFRQRFQAVREAAAGTVVTIRIGGGAERRVTLADWF